MARYEIRAWGGRVFAIEADSSTAAKRAVCKILGRPANAPLIGIKGMSARKLSNQTPCQQ